MIDDRDKRRLLMECRAATRNLVHDALADGVPPASVASALLEQFCALSDAYREHDERIDQLWQKLRAELLLKNF